jgi:hypothetical protein
LSNGFENFFNDFFEQILTQIRYWDVHRIGFNIWKLVSPFISWESSLDPAV